MTRQARISRRGLLGAAAALGTTGLVGGSPPARAATRRRGADRPAAQLPSRSEFVVRGAHVLTMDPALGDLPRGDVHVRDGIIVAVGTNLAAPGAMVLDARDTIALPGFVDTHWHLWTSSLRALIRNDEAPAYGYFAVTPRVGLEYTPEDAYRAVRLGLAEGLYSGITTVHDWSHNILSPAHADADLRALADVGIRARFAYGYSRQLQLEPELPMDVADIARVQREWLGRPNEGLLTLGMASRGRGPGPAGRDAVPRATARLGRHAQPGPPDHAARGTRGRGNGPGAGRAARSGRPARPPDEHHGGRAGAAGRARHVVQFVSAHGAAPPAGGRRRAGRRAAGCRCPGQPVRR